METRLIDELLHTLATKGATHRYITLELVSSRDHITLYLRSDAGEYLWLRHFTVKQTTLKDVYERGA